MTETIWSQRLINNRWDFKHQLKNGSLHFTLTGEIIIIIYIIIYTIQMVTCHKKATCIIIVLLFDDFSVIEVVKNNNDLSVIKCHRKWKHALVCYKS